MAKITSTASGGTITYIITDQANNTVTITAPAPPGGLTFVNSGALLADGQQLLSSLILMLQTGLRPNVMANTTASFSS